MSSHRCKTHRRYETLAAAEKALSASAIHFLKKGSDWMRLNVFACGDHWHIGRKPVEDWLRDELTEAAENAENRATIEPEETNAQPE